MFTGLIQDIGKITEISPNKDGIKLRIETSLANEIKINDSVATNGVCLTATEVTSTSFTCQAIPVTMEKTSLRDLCINSQVNLELAMKPTDRLGGHFVQGHVNGTGIVDKIKQGNETWEITLKIPQDLRRYLILEGSIALDGIILTIARLEKGTLTVAIIPHTLEKTNLSEKKIGDVIKIEVDMLAKYVENFISLRKDLA